MPTFRMKCTDCGHIDTYIGGDVCNTCGNTSKFNTTYKSSTTGSVKITRCGHCRSADVGVRVNHCTKCQSKNLEQDIPRAGDAVASFVGERDWTRNLTNSQISDYLTPDDRGNFKDPY